MTMLERLRAYQAELKTAADLEAIEALEAAHPEEAELNAYVIKVYTVGVDLGEVCGRGNATLDRHDAARGVLRT